MGEETAREVARIGETVVVGSRSNERESIGASRATIPCAPPRMFGSQVHGPWRLRGSRHLGDPCRHADHRGKRRGAVGPGSAPAGIGSERPADDEGAHAHRRSLDGRHALAGLGVAVDADVAEAAYARVASRRPLTFTRTRFPASALPFIAVVDDYTIARDGLAQLLRSHPGSISSAPPETARLSRVESGLFRSAVRLHELGSRERRPPRRDPSAPPVRSVHRKRVRNGVLRGGG